MKFVHTFWSKPLLNKKFGDYNKNLKIILFTYSLSVICIKNLGEKIVLYTDSFGKNLLGFLDYDDIIVIDDIDDDIDCAARYKFYALNNCNPGDILIDGDIFIENKECIDAINNSNCDVLYSFYEPFLEIFTRNKSNIDIIELIYLLHNIETKYGCYVPTKITHISWPNTSLLRINKKEIIDLYIEQYNYHKELIKDINFKYSWPDIIIEQKFLEDICKINEWTIEPLIPNYPEISALDYGKQLGFTHLGGGKNDVIDDLYKILEYKDNNIFNKCIQQLELYKQDA